MSKAPAAGGTSTRQRRRGRNTNPPPPGPGRPHGLDQLYTWPGDEQRIPVSEAIPRWMRTTGCLWQEATLACGITINTAEGWLRVGARADKSMIVGRLETDLSDYERKCMAFSRAILIAAAETVTRWQSILEREGRGGYPITRTTTREKLDPATGNVVERSTETVTEYARPDTNVLRWRMAKMLPAYRDRPLVEVHVGDQVLIAPGEDDELARGIADDLRRFAAQPRAIEATATDSGESAKSPRAGNRPAATDSAKDQVDS